MMTPRLFHFVFHRFFMTLPLTLLLLNLFWAGQAFGMSGKRAHTPKPKVNPSVAGVYLRTDNVLIYDQTEPDGGKMTNVESCMELRPVDPKTMDVEIELIQANAHMCFLKGRALLVNHQWVVSETASEGLPDADVGPGCQLTLDVSPKQVGFKDPDYQCQRYHCGARASFDGVTFPRQHVKPLTAEHPCAGE